MVHSPSGATFRPDEIALPDYAAPESTNFSDPSKRFFSGHFRFMAINTKRPIRAVTFLRDPLQRTASHYRSWHNKEFFSEAWRARANEDVVDAVEWVQRSSFEDFVRSDNPIIQGNIRDVQTAYLSSFSDVQHPKYLPSALKNLKQKFFFVGLQEHSKTSIQLYNHQAVLTSDPGLSLRNVSDSYDATHSATGKDRLLELLQKDFAVYQLGRRLFERRLSEMSRGRKDAA
jgi:hypothetical protein